MDYSEEAEDDGDEWRQMLECSWTSATTAEVKDTAEDFAEGDDAAGAEAETPGAEEVAAEASGTVEFEISDEEGEDDNLGPEAAEAEADADGDEAEVNTAGAEFREALDDLPEEAPAEKPKLQPAAKQPPAGKQPVAKHPVGKAPVAKHVLGKAPVAKQPALSVPALAARPPAGARPPQVVAAARVPVAGARPVSAGAKQGVVVKPPVAKFPMARQGVVVRPPGQPVASAHATQAVPNLAGKCAGKGKGGGVVVRPPGVASAHATQAAPNLAGKSAGKGKGVPAGAAAAAARPALATARPQAAVTGGPPPGSKGGGKAGQPQQQQQQHSVVGGGKGKSKGGGKADKEGQAVKPKRIQGQHKATGKIAMKTTDKSSAKANENTHTAVIREAKRRLGREIVETLADKAKENAEKALAAVPDSEEKDARLKKVRIMNLARLIQAHDKKDAEGGAKVVKHNLWKGGTHSGKRAAESSSGGPALKKSRSSQDVVGGPADAQGRQFDMTQVVVNLANVGANFGTKILNRDLANQRDKITGLFDWEGVRRCCKFLRKERGWTISGVINENFMGTDQREGTRRKVPVPEDIKKMCDLLETPRLTGSTHSSADDEMTIRSAYRRNCRFLDNDNYRDWLQQLKDEKVRAWLNCYQDMLQLRYYWDKGTGTFELLEGNIPDHMLASGVKTIDKRQLWTAARA